MSTTMLLYCLALSGVASAQTVHTVPADFTESLHVEASATISHVERTSESTGTQQNDALQTIVSSSFFGSGVEVEVRRSFLEFTLPDVQGTATLVLEKYYEINGPNRAILVSAYTPDAELTAEDFDRAVQDLGLLPTQPNVSEETVRFDLTALLGDYAGGPLGIRLSVVDETPGDDLFTGAAFKDAYLGAAPYIEVDDGTGVQVVPADRTESLHQSYSGQVFYEPGFDALSVRTQENDALQTIVMWGGPTGRVRRTFLEFTLPDVGGSATLVLEKYYDTHVTDPARRILVSAYTPGDDLGTDDWDLPVTELGTLVTDPSVDQETVWFDLSPLLESYAGARLGIRLTVLDEGPGLGSFLFAGAAFRDAYAGAQPYIQVVESKTGKVVVCHTAGASGRALTLPVGFDAVADHVDHGDTITPCP